MDPAVLIFLLYVMIAHELVCALMDYRKRSAKPHRRAAVLLRSSARQRAWRANDQSVSSYKAARDLRKSSRIVRKA